MKRFENRRSPFSPWKGEKVAVRPDEGVFAGSDAVKFLQALPAAPLAGRCIGYGERVGQSVMFVNPRRRSGGTTVSRSLRKGAFFNYIMVYMTISSALMMTAGLCLHAILKADTSERRESLFLSSLHRAEHQLREDSRYQGMTYESPTSILAVTSEETSILWVAERGRLTRTEKRLDEIVASDRFIFPAGSQIVMEQGPENSVVIRITEPSVFITYSQVASGGSNLNKPIEEATPTTPTHVAQPNITEIRLRGAQ